MFLIISEIYLFLFRTHVILPFFRLLFAMVESPIIKIVMGSFLSAIKADNRSKAHKTSNTFNFMFFIYI